MNLFVSGYLFRSFHTSANLFNNVTLRIYNHDSIDNYLKNAISTWNKYFVTGEDFTPTGTYSETEISLTDNYTTVIIDLLTNNVTKSYANIDIKIYQHL